MAKRERGEERRRSDRIDASLALELTGTTATGALQMMTESINISTGGVYCCVKSEVPMLTKLELSIQLPKFGTYKSTQVLRVDAIVVRCQQAMEPSAMKGPRYNLACAFEGVESETQGLINEFILWKILRPAGR